MIAKLIARVKERLRRVTHLHDWSAPQWLIVPGRVYRTGSIVHHVMPRRSYVQFCDCGAMRHAKKPGARHP